MVFWVGCVLDLTGIGSCGRGDMRCYMVVWIMMFWVVSLVCVGWV